MQATNNILLVRPSSFGFNTETAASNTFQIALDESSEVIKQKKLREFDGFVSRLRAKGVNVLVAEDTLLPEKPDAVFPNNWATFHADGTVILYPMCAPNRRPERRPDIIDFLKTHFVVTSVLDFSEYEAESRYLEGTGSIVFDHVHKLAYACLSPRTDEGILAEVCQHLGYRPVCFHAHDRSGKAIYHTNVMMCIGDSFSVICLDAISDATEKTLVLAHLEETGHQVVPISFGQMNSFAGNMLALRTRDNAPLLAMSQSAFASLTAGQRAELAAYTELLPLPIETIETIGGGSARCMIAEVFLPPI